MLPFKLGAFKAAVDRHLGIRREDAVVALEASKRDSSTASAARRKARTRKVLASCSSSSAAASRNRSATR